MGTANALRLVIIVASCVIADALAAFTPGSPAFAPGSRTELRTAVDGCTSSDGTRQQDQVRKDYADTITGQQEGTIGCCQTSIYGKSMGYSAEDLKLKGDDINLSCGNPVTLAALQPGEYVLDLGSGAGLDAILAAKQVGESGYVIGVDMTPEMLEKARKAVRKQGLDKSVSLRLGEIEHLPVADSTVDVVISNCVINLSPDKPQVFRECFRILRNGGRIAIADVVAKSEIPERLKTNKAVSCWVGGAPQIESLTEMLRDAGFVGIRVDVKEESAKYIAEWIPGSGAEDYVVSASITARKSGVAPARPTPKQPCAKAGGWPPATKQPCAKAGGWPPATKQPCAKAGGWPPKTVAPTTKKACSKRGW